MDDSALQQLTAGFSFGEIGQMLGIRADAAKLRLSRGMGDLRRLLIEITRGSPIPHTSSVRLTVTFASSATSVAHHSHS